MSDFWQIYDGYEDERIRTESNQRHYRKVISDLETQLNTEFLNITPAQANTYYETIKAADLALTTKNERLRIVKSIGLYMENKIPGYRSPFTHLRPYSDQSFLHASEVPSMEDLSAVMAVAEVGGKMREFMAMSLAFRMCLTTSELVSLRSVHFKTQPDGQMYLDVPANEFRERTIPVPEDIVTMIRQVEPGFFLGESKPLLYNARNKKPIRDVTLAKQIAIISREADIKITLQDIRNLGILLYYKENPNKEALAEYLGTDGRWLFRYDLLARQPIRSIRSPNVTVHLSSTKSVSQNY